MAKPNARQILIRKEERGKDPLVDKILGEPDSPEAKLWPKCADIFDSRIKRGYVEACLMSTVNYDEISKLLEVPIEVLKLYEETCFDIKGYDRLSKVDLLDKEKDKDILVMKMWALHQGLDFVAWRLGKKVDISPLEGLTDMFTMCIYKSKEALFNSNSSSASVESTKWAKLSLDIARMLKVWVLDNDVARRDLELAIKEVVPEFRSLDDVLAEAERMAREPEQKPSEEAKKIIQEILNNEESEDGDESGTN
jgi:hypothetical protein